METNNYSVDVLCSNCVKEIRRVYVQKGTPVCDFECPVCGCKKLSVITDLNIRY